MNRTPADNKNTIKIENPEPEFYIRTSPASKYVIEYHRDMCIGAASCAAIAPMTFRMDEENKAVIVEDGEVISEKGNSQTIVMSEVDEDDAILAAAQSCPVFAIIVKDAETGEQVFPPM